MDFEKTVDELIDGAAKPLHSLGLLEKHLKKVLMAWEKIHTEIRPYHIIYAADNGVVEESIAPDPVEFTYLQARNMAAGLATISCFCQMHQIPYEVIDIGIRDTREAGVCRKVAFGTKNFMKEEAMSQDEFQKAWDIGRERVQKAVREKGANLLSFGEMGIGNTTTSSAVLHALTGMPPEFVVGHGAGLKTPEALRRKRQIVEKGVEKHKVKLHAVEDILRCVGGFDIVAMCSSMLECAKLKVPFVLDGFITAVAYACAVRVNSKIDCYAIPSHMSKEPGMAYCLLLGNIMAEDVILKADMALGEGTGAVLMVSILKTMLYAMQNVARISDFLASTSNQNLAI
ncbi:MAG: nicotinate-nucleotide--dimethylbenzimidazole phosphoribosyltransferase [Sporomusaceae bacterium]|nr:nicotinate-nucleotide--dimethylbenzimidazole phosphoribosyltransferase [Sporomusaceae bacterium]